MKDLTIVTTSRPPSYVDDSDVHDDHLEKEKKKDEQSSLVPLIPCGSPTSTLANYDAVQYEKVVPGCTGGHDIKLNAKCRAMKIIPFLVCPCLGAALAFSPAGRRRTCRNCGVRVTVPAKNAFC